MTEATTKPWAVIQDQYGNESIVDSIGDYVVEMAEQTIDAHEIVKAVNSHDALVAALVCAEADLEGLVSESEQDDHPAWQTLKEIRTALEAAK